MLHFKAHQENWKGLKLSSFGEGAARVEVKKLFLISYLQSKERIFITTDPRNKKKMKEMLYHYMTCECRLNELIGECSSIDEIVERLIADMQKKWEEYEDGKDSAAN